MVYTNAHTFHPATPLGGVHSRSLQLGYVNSGTHHMHMHASNKRILILHSPRRYGKGTSLPQAPDPASHPLQYEIAGEGLASYTGLQLGYEARKSLVPNLT